MVSLPPSERLDELVDRLVHGGGRFLPLRIDALLQGVLHQHGVDHVRHQLGQSLAPVGCLVGRDVEIGLPSIERSPVLRIAHLGKSIDDGLDRSFRFRVEKAAAERAGVQFVLPRAYSSSNVGLDCFFMRELELFPTCRELRRTGP